MILPDIRGLYRFYEELALRFAERGHTAVAIDYFGRTAGVEKRGDDFEWQPHVQQTTADGVQADTAPRSPGSATPAARRSSPSASASAAATRGSPPRRGHGLRGAIGFYGRPGPGQDGSPGPPSVPASSRRRSSG